MIMVSHFKGHPLAGYGGAIKNLGIRCVSKKTKLAQHRLVDLEIHLELCQGCGMCLEACDFGYPHIEDDTAVIDHPECMRCLSCNIACPEAAIELVGKARLGTALAITVTAVLPTFKRDKVAYINFTNDITTFCDCTPIPGESLGPDLGIFAGVFPLSVDAAALMQIDYNRLNEIHHTDCSAQINKLARLNDPGSLEPKIVEF